MPQRPGYADDPLFGEAPWRSDQAYAWDRSPLNPGGNGHWPYPDGRDRPTAEEPEGAHRGGTSVDELLAAHGASAAPRARHRRRDE